jgi:hypothetical protein
MTGVHDGSAATEDALEETRGRIARAIYDVSNRWVAGNFPEGHEFRDFSQVDERTCNLHFEYAEAVLAVLPDSCGAESNRHSGAVGAEKRAEQSNPGGGHEVTEGNAHTTSAKPLPDEPTPAVGRDGLAQSPVRHLQCERCGEVAIASGAFCDDCAELSIGSAQPPAAPVEPRFDALQDAMKQWFNSLPSESLGKKHWQRLVAILKSTPVQPSSAANGDALSIAETDREVMRQAIVEACDLLAERKYGNPARSPGHNARLVLERALSTGIPALPQEALRYAATKAVEAYRRAQSEGEVVIAMENLERALSPDEPRCSVTRPMSKTGDAQ